MTTSEPTTKTCSRCGATFTGTIFLCEKCDAKSEGEYGVKFNEPTTGEIVRALRCVADDTECKDCRYKYPVGNVILCDHEQMNGNAADRLESQEQTIAGMKEFHEKCCSEMARAHVEEVTALTARAEQAEAREKAAIERMRGSCQFCIGYEREENEYPCNTCYNARTFEPDDIPRTQNWEYSGQPQEGNGK